MDKNVICIKWGTKFGPEYAYAGFCGKGGFRYVKPTKWLDKYWKVEG